MELLLYEPLPLRTTRQLGDFAEDEPLAHVYGDLTSARFPLRRISATRGHAADHPMQITGAGSGNTATLSFAAVIEPDDTGHVCTFVDFGAPVPDGEIMWAFGRGKRSPTTNVLLTSPGDIMTDISNVIARRTDSYQSLREEGAGLRLAGRVAVPIGTSIRATLDIPAQSAGAIWAPGMVARRYPALVAGYVLELDKHSAENVRVSASVEDTADVLHIAYDQCDVTGRPQKSITLTASPLRYGALPKELSLPWLRMPVDAVDVGAPILQRLSAERYDVAFYSSDTSIRPGQWLRLVAHPEWPFPGADPVIMTLAVTVNRTTKTVAVSGETLLTTPTITVTAHSVVLDDLSGESLEISERNGIATFTVRDENGRGIPGARVSFDGGEPKTTDARGQVSFAYTPGEHEIAIEAPGRVPQMLTVTL